MDVSARGRAHGLEVFREGGAMVATSRLEAEALADSPHVERCPACDSPAFLDVAEVHERTFELDACCEANRDGWIEEMRTWTADRWRAWFERKTARRLRDVITDCETWTLDYGLRIDSISFDQARAFIAQHHRHNKPPAGWKFGACIRDACTGELYAVLMCGRPISRITQQSEPQTLEVTRVCVKQVHPQRLTYRACSMLYRHAADVAADRGYTRLITFTRQDENALSVKAGGFTYHHEVKAQKWDRPSRRRGEAAEVTARVCWERRLQPIQKRTGQFLMFAIQ